MKKLLVCASIAFYFVACDTPESTTSNDSATDSTVLNPEQSKVTYDTTAQRDTTMRDTTTNRPDSLR